MPSVFAPPPTESFLVTDARHRITSHCAASFGAHVIPHPSLPGARLFVKRGNPSLIEEARTQAYLYQHVRSSSTAPSMAEVYGTLYDDNGSTYLVMKHIDDAVSFRVWIEGSADEQEHEERSVTAVAAITDAVARLITCPLPDAGRIGPVGGFYGMAQAPVPFVDAATRQRGALCAAPDAPRPSPMSPSSSDITLGNFLWDPSRGCIWLIDCQDIDVLPASFQLLPPPLHLLPPPYRPARARLIFPCALGAAAAIIMHAERQFVVRWVANCVESDSD
ncbi:hypothetical protein C8R45DRAFT_1162656 [Mycena sanguinolenta]|nr:hypothetical protein C8R45DRAFT_1162656 [Mycena sanguinolenta]